MPVDRSDGNARGLDPHTTLIAEAAARAAVDHHMATCPIVAEFKTMHADIYGLPGLKDEDHSPGLMGDVASLKKSRNLARIGIRALWAVLVSTPLLGWLLAHFGAFGQVADRAK